MKNYNKLVKSIKIYKINNSLITAKLPWDTTNLYTVPKKETLIYWPADDYNYNLSLPPKTKTSQNNDNNTNLKAHINKQANNSKKHKSNKTKKQKTKKEKEKTNKQTIIIITIIIN